LLSALVHISVLIAFESTFLKPSETLVSIQIRQHLETPPKARAKNKISAPSPSPSKLDDRVNSTGAPSDAGQAPSITGAELGIEAGYPKISRLLRESGEVVLKLEPTSGGGLSSVVLVKSSGFARLDQAATEALSKAVAKGQVSLKTLQSNPITFVFRLK
jgi:protein TonB